MRYLYLAFTTVRWRDGNKKLLNEAEHLDVRLDMDRIEQVGEFKYLGVWLDSSLKFTCHISKMSSKISSAIGVISRVSRYLPGLWFNVKSISIQILCVCLSSIGGQTAGPIMTKFGTHMRIDLGMVPTKYWPHEWPGSVGSLGPISESGLSCQVLLRAVVC